MKTLIRALTIIAILNIGAILAGAGWLMLTQRVDTARLTEVVDSFKETIPQEEARLKAEQAELARIEAEKEPDIPEIAMSADELNTVRVELTQIDRARLERMQREIQDLRDTLRRERALLASERADLEQEQADFDAMRARLASIEGSEQFTKALNSISQMAPKDAMETLDTLIEQGRVEQVVSYLSAMGDRIRTDVLTQFVKAGQPELAAQLLESVRTKGLEAARVDEPEQ